MDEIPLPPSSPQYSPSQITSPLSDFEAGDTEEMPTVQTAKPSPTASVSPAIASTALSRAVTPVVSAVLGKDKAKQRLKAFAASKTGGISFGVLNIGKKLVKTDALKVFSAMDDEEEEEKKESSSHGNSSGAKIKDAKSTPKLFMMDDSGELAKKVAAEAAKKINKVLELAGDDKESAANHVARDSEGSQKSRHSGKDERERSSRKERQSDIEQDSRRRERRRSEEKRRDRDSSPKRSERPRHSPKKESPKKAVSEKLGIRNMPTTWNELKPLALSDSDLQALKKELVSSSKDNKCAKNCVLVKKAASGLEALDPFTLQCERALATSKNRELSTESITDAKYYAEFECPLQRIQKTKTTPSLEWCVRNACFYLSRDEVLSGNSEQSAEMHAILDRVTNSAPAETPPLDKEHGDEREWFPKEDESLKSRPSAAHFENQRLSASKAIKLPCENEKTKSMPSSLRVKLPGQETVGEKEHRNVNELEESEKKEKRKRKRVEEEESVEVKGKKKRKKDKSKKKKKSKDVKYESEEDVADTKKKKRKKAKEDANPDELRSPPSKHAEVLPLSERKPLDNKLLSLAGYAGSADVDPAKSSSRRASHSHHDDSSERRRRADQSFSPERKRHAKDRSKAASKAPHEDHHVSEGRVRPSQQQHGPRTPSPFCGEAVAGEDGDWRRPQPPVSDEWPSSPRSKAARRRSPSPSPVSYSSPGRRQWRPPSPSRSRNNDVTYSPSPPPGARGSHRRGSSRSPSPPRYGGRFSRSPPPRSSPRQRHYADPSASSRPHNVPRWSHSPSPPPPSQAQAHRGRAGPPSPPRGSSSRRRSPPRHAPRGDHRDRDWSQDRGGRGYAPRGGSGDRQDFSHLPPPPGHVLGAGGKPVDSPKRLSLDERLEKELGIKVHNEAQRHLLAAPPGFPVVDYSRPPPGYLPTGQRVVVPPPTSAASRDSNRDAAHQPQEPAVAAAVAAVAAVAAPPPDVPEEGRLVRVGNMLQIVPEDGDATPTADEPPTDSFLPAIVPPPAAPPPPVVVNAKPPQEMPTIMKKMEELKKKEEAERLRRRERKLAARLSMEKKAEEQKLEQATVENADAVETTEAMSDEASTAKRILERIEQEEEEDQEAREAKLLQEAISSVPEMDSDEEYKEPDPLSMTMEAIRQRRKNGRNGEDVCYISLKPFSKKERRRQMRAAAAARSRPTAENSPESDVEPRSPVPLPDNSTCKSILVQLGFALSEKRNKVLRYSDGVLPGQGSPDNPGNDTENDSEGSDKQDSENPPVRRRYKRLGVNIIRTRSLPVPADDDDGANSSTIPPSGSPPQWGLTEFVQKYGPQEHPYASSRL